MRNDLGEVEGMSRGKILSLGVKEKRKEIFEWEISANLLYLTTR